LPPEVSIITVYYNTPDDLRKLSDSMKTHLPADVYEWIVADNNSAEDMSAKLPSANYLRFSENYGFGKANNLAAEKATAPYLFFVNPDCEFVENCIPPLLAVLKDAAVAAPRVLNPDGSIQLSFGPYLSIWKETQQKRRMQNEQTQQTQQWIRKKGTFCPEFVSGCALMIRADVYRNVGGFDPVFFLYHEDVDLCKRVSARGQSIVYLSTARIVHARNRSVDQIRERVNIEIRKSQIYFYRKHNSPLQLLLLKLYLTLKFPTNREMLALIWHCL